MYYYFARAFFPLVIYKYLVVPLGLVLSLTSLYYYYLPSAYTTADYYCYYYLLLLLLLLLETRTNTSRFPFSTLPHLSQCLPTHMLRSRRAPALLPPALCHRLQNRDKVARQNH